LNYFKYIFIYLLTSFSLLTNIIEAAPQKVIHVLKEAVTPNYSQTHFMILEDKTAWSIEGYFPVYPEVGDTVETLDGTRFKNLNCDEEYSCHLYGTVDRNPLTIENVMTASRLDFELDADPTFRNEVGDVSHKDNKGLKLFLLSNRLIYEDGFEYIHKDGGGQFGDWESAEFLYLIHPNNPENLEYLIWTEQGEARPVKSHTYQPTNIIAANVDSRTFILENCGIVWNTTNTYAAVLDQWEPSDLVYVFPIENDAMDEELEEEVFFFPRLLFRLQHGIDPEDSFLKICNLRTCAAVNMNTGDIVFAWSWDI